MALAMELLDCKSPLATLERDRDAHDAASAGLESLQRLIHLLSHQHTFPLQQQQVALQEACSTVADATISKFKKVCSLLTKSGHARFRRCPGSQAASLNNVSEAALMEAPVRSELDFNKDSFSSSPESSCSMHTPPTPIAAGRTHQDAYEANTSVSRPNVVLPQQQVQVNHNILAISSEMSSQGHVLMETSYGKNSNAYPLLAYPPQQIFFQGPSTLNPSEKASHIKMSYGKSATTYSLSEHSMGSLVMPSHNIDGSTSKDKSAVLEQVFGGGGRPPLSVSKKCIGGKLDEHGARCHCSGKCHCSKRRKSRDRRTIRVPAISAKMTDIPQDEFAWRKYGQKPIKGSPHPRSYYRCSSARDCPAKKRVERACDDSNMLMVTYEEEHNHGEIPSDNAVV